MGGGQGKARIEHENAEHEAAVEALEMWSRAGPASADHAYAARKRLDPAPLRELDGKLLIPMVDAAGKLWNLQRIAGDGTKRFLRGGRVEGLFHLIAYAVTDASSLLHRRGLFDHGGGSPRVRPSVHRGVQCQEHGGGRADLEQSAA
jgi:phage/plasmid primase-like uncharacterized protein